MIGDDRRTQKHRRADYQTVLSTIANNTGDPQPPLLDARALWTTLVANGRLAHDIAESSVRAARENGDVVRWTDGDGCVRYALTDSGLDAVRASDPYGDADAEALRQCIATEADRDDADQQFIGWANRRLSSL